MAILVMFEVDGATSSKYDEVIRRLTETGQRVPDGQLYHVCYGDRQRLQVIDVFESQRWTPSVGPLGGISKVDSAVLVAASKGNSERGRA